MLHLSQWPIAYACLHPRTRIGDNDCAQLDSKKLSKQALQTKLCRTRTLWDVSDVVGILRTSQPDLALNS
jgi:hypothetical protein